MFMIRALADTINAKQMFATGSTEQAKKYRNEPRIYNYYHAPAYTDYQIQTHSDKMRQ